MISWKDVFTAFKHKGATLAVSVFLSLALWRLIYSSTSVDVATVFITLLSLQYLSTIVTLGSHFSLGKSVLEKAAIRPTVLAMLILKRTLLGFLFIGFILVGLVLIGVIPDVSPWQLLLAAAFLSSGVYQNFTNSYFISSKKLGSLAWTPLLVVTVQLIAVLVSSIFTDQISLEVLFIIFFIANLLGASSSIFIISLFEKRHLVPKGDIGVVTKLTSDYGALFVSVFTPVFFQLDRLMASSFGSTEALAEAALLSRLLAPILGFTALLANFAYPIIAESIRPAAATRTLLRIAVIGGASTGLACFTLAGELSNFISGGELQMGLASSALFGCFVFSSWVYSIPDAIFRSVEGGQSTLARSLFLAILAVIIASPLAFSLFGLAGYFGVASIALMSTCLILLVIAFRKFRGGIVAD